jgi:hypothetical protein
MSNVEQKLRTDLAKFAQELTGARDEVSRLKGVIAKLEDRITYIRDILGETEGTLIVLPTNVNRYLGGGESIPVEEQPGQTSALIRRILTDAGTPLHIRAIAERAITAGYGGPGASFERVMQNLSSLLAKAKRDPQRTGITKIGRGRFDLFERAVQSGLPADNSEDATDAIDEP